ncbi:YdiU family protein [Nocardioides zeae]|uniref:Protein nucleotidyltransferase YdiU n=1 Tax=Nocardioides imazamoxiresistens TaxID=3231893 RepID=A0ABU3PWZ3_9ACTN|nr:YdiU family protein [Nocardioides zeae]MDT9593770.1 YdiU family protein [Nocardioides zeae]
MPVTAPVLGTSFADALPELATPWRAEEAPAPELVVLNEPVALELGLDPEALRGPEGLGLLTGVEPPPGARPVAQAYAGHQFGGFSPRLGDGRALLLGELTGPDGRVRDLHLKGSGRTPYARGGDGRALLGPMLREHVVSEALHALGVPTTRSLAVVATGRTVQRETPGRGAVLARVAASHLRVGSFQYARLLDSEGDGSGDGSGSGSGSGSVLRRLADHAIARHHPQAAADPAPYRALYRAVVHAQARLVARWMDVGFVHGVMNTDNTTISGETIDYGPCAFLDGYDPATVFSSIDTQGRYSFGNQPGILQWNLARLAEAMLPLLADDEQEAIAVATELLGEFTGAYAAARAEGMRAKLSLPAGLDDDATAELVDGLLVLLGAERVDWTTTFRALGAAARGDREPVRALVLDRPALDAWLERWLATSPDGDAMDRVNPVYVPRNHLVDEALVAAEAGDFGPLDSLMEVLRSPFVVQEGRERYAEPAPATFTEGFRTFCGT